MSDKVSGRKQSSFVPRQGTSREKGTSSSDTSVYKSSAEESVRYKSTNLSSVYKSSEEYFEYSCDLCKTAGDNAEAQGYCSNCEEYLCGTCFRSHSRSKASKYHTLLDKDNMPRKTVKKCDLCKTAGDEVEAAGYCKDCDEYLCVSCYKSHSRSKSSRHHALFDKDRMPEKSDRAVTTSIAKMNIHTEGASELKYNEEYTHIRDINIKACTDEKDCYITGMTLLSITELVPCDYNNNSLKLVDVENGSIKDVLVLQAKPVGITAISKDQFQILQLTVAIFKTIKPESEVLKHCTVSRHFAVSPDESMIYVSDWKTNKVMSMDMNGNMISMYKGELEESGYIIISLFGSVYLCNRRQHIVYKMTPDLREATVILGLGDGLNGPHAMCFNTNKQHLYLSSGSGDAKYKNFIKVYKWK